MSMIKALIGISVFSIIRAKISKISKSKLGKIDF